MKTVNYPNLFSYATSELSQDAFICWLLEWAAPEHASENREMHSCGTDLINAFFDKNDQAPPLIEDVEIRKQYKNIDILCIINKKIPIIIEDKTNTGAHSGQLKRYYEQVCNIEEFSERDIIRIYFKTHDQSDYKKIESDGYKVFSRQDFLGILNKYPKTDSDIYNDFRAYLNEIEDNVQSYKTNPKEKWTNKSWTGFYIALKEVIGAEDSSCNWKYVPNQSGGFMGFWWGFDTTNDVRSHLQLEGNKKINRLVFKVTTATPTRKLHTDWSSKLNELSAEYNLSITKPKRKLNELSAEYNLSITKPKRLGSGRSVTVAVLEGDFRVFSDGVIDMDATVALLKKAQSVLDKAREAIETAERVPEALA
jgi:hypothetical protein